MMVVFGNEPKPEAFAGVQATLRAKQVVWSIMGDASSTRNDDGSDLDTVIALARNDPTVVGGIMDDLFLPEMREDGRVARWGAATIAVARARLHAARPDLRLYAVFYDQLLDNPDPRYRHLLVQHLACSDVMTYWTWQAAALERLEENFARAEAMVATTGVRIFLGCYLFDYGGGNQPMPVERMQYQCETGLRWLRQGRIAGMIFLANTVCDIGLRGGGMDAGVDRAILGIGRVGQVD